MSADRELLELAAKAAGKDIDPARYDEDDGFAIRHMAKWWNPLTDDGDALRLAVKLGLKINFSFAAGIEDRPGVGVWLPEDREAYPPFWQYDSGDKGAAARQTIVRAAAEIGKSMNRTAP